MPAEKSARSSLKKRARNRSIRSSTRTMVKTAIETITSGEQGLTQDAVARAVRSLDKAAKRGAIHRNNAARRKSRLMRRLNASSGDK